MLLVIFSGATAAAMEGSLLDRPHEMGLFLLGLFLSGGAANSLNQYFERSIDARMKRTSYRRPLPLGQISATSALVFSLVIGISGVLVLGFVFNLLTALLALGTILFYGFVYTLLLKPNTSLNIVIGGVAGAMAPVGAWAAATGGTALTPWLLFLLIFLWTPPHFWSLALCFKDDYEATELPMLPNVRGDRATLDQAFIYVILVVLVSLIIAVDTFGWLYLTTAVILGGLYIKKAYFARKHNTHELNWKLFKFSILYLFTLLFCLLIEALI